MKKRVIFIILFFLGMLLVLYMTSCILLPKKNLKSYGMDEDRANAILAEKENTIDVLMVGNSLAYFDYCPPLVWKEKGYTSYTCGTNDQFLDYTYEMILRVLDHHQPKIILMETESFYRDVTAFTALLSEASHIFPCFRYHDRCKDLKMRDFLPPYRTEYCYQSAYQGYVFLEDDRPSPKKDIRKHMRPTDKVKTVSKWNQIYLNRIADLCEKNDIKLVFISMPNTLTWNMEMHNGAQAVAKNIGCEYIDMNLINDQVGINFRKDTNDKGEHMNYTGAAKVTTFIANYLEQTNLLEDHRGDQAYSDWEDHLARYEQHMLERKEDQEKNQKNLGQDLAGLELIPISPSA